MRTNLWDDPRVSNLVDLVGAGEAAVVGALYWLWASADTHSVDGLMHGLSVAGIDRRTGVTGFGSALAAIGWIEEKPEGIYIFKFDEHNGASAKRRSQDAKMKASSRKMSGSNADNLPTGSRHDAEDVRSNSGQQRELEQEQEEERDINLLPPGGDGKGGAVGEGGKGEKAERVDRTAQSVPYQDIVAEYHKALPMLPAVRILTPTRKKKISARWHESPKRQTVEFWAQYFAYAAKSDFLTGRNGAWTACDFEWLVELSNFAKVVEGKYSNKGADA